MVAPLDLPQGAVITKLAISVATTTVADGGGAPDTDVQAYILGSTIQAGRVWSHLNPPIVSVKTKDAVGNAVAYGNAATQQPVWVSTTRAAFGVGVATFAEPANRVMVGSTLNDARGYWIVVRMERNTSGAARAEEYCQFFGAKIWYISTIGPPASMVETTNYANDKHIDMSALDRALAVGTGL